MSIVVKNVFSLNVPHGHDWRCPWTTRKDIEEEGEEEGGEEGEEEEKGKYIITMKIV